MSQRIVTAQVLNDHSLREEMVQNDSVKILPGEFTLPGANGEQVAFRFKNRDNSPAQDLAIVGLAQFDLTNPTDNHNLKVLRAFLIAFPEYTQFIKINDPEKEADRDIELAELSLELANKIKENESNKEWIVKLYRRLIGSAAGITDKQVYRALADIARKDPEQFKLASGKLLYEDESFDTIAKLDQAVEIGFFTRGADDTIRRRNGEIYADSFEKAVFRLSNDQESLDRLRMEVSGGVPAETKYIPKIENSELVNLMSEIGESSQADGDLPDGSFDTNKKEEDFDATLEDKINKLIDLNFIEKTKAGRWDRFVLPGLPNKFGMEELKAYLKMNRKQFEDLIKRANI
jgi:hypothetical protein